MKPTIQENSAQTQLQDFFKRYRTQSFDRNQLLCMAGEEPAGVFYIEHGEVRQYDISQQGEEIVVNVFKPGSFFPMAWAINKEPNQYFFAAATLVDVKIAPAEDVVEFLKTNPEVSFDLLTRVFRGLEGMQRRMFYLMSSDAKTRVLYELSLQAKRFGKKETDGSLMLELREDELAHRAGLSRETINRELAKLKKQGTVKVDSRGIIISDLQDIDKLIDDAINND